MVDVTAEVEFDGNIAVKLQGGDAWELNIRASPADFAKLQGIQHTARAGRSLAVGRCAGAPAWWNERDGQVTILVGHDDVTWDVAVIVPLAAIDAIAQAVEHELLAGLTDLRRLVAGAVRPPEAGPPEGASPQQLAALSARLGNSLPLPLRLWLSICRGAPIGPGGVFGHRPDQPSLDMVKIRDIFPEWQVLDWLPVASDGCGNYYVLTGDSTIGFVDTMSDPGRLARQVAPDLLSFMVSLLADDQG